ncbi:6-carboxytetrahydropterin synthase [Biformimicrobium ophioploci]|uniref:6-carboxy-5,6,7,8-tetrahydropterin synthase n=1 Tax=Biformimicrobium ophioploci TaxID=3036711 RepID=A0ABQ6M2H3_9GAMM|nr:6-carboxytetrahydropterin synthase [Microbulbifer sp. NKW57]GMG88558.1 6-carboxytetrahydropterin synthase [Microbulbifer sp. NKW57]
MHLFVDNLINVDFSFLDPDRGIVGETWLAHATLDGALDSQGMVCDFGVVKKTLRSWLDEEIDHRLLVPLQAPELQLTQDSDDAVKLEWRLGSGETIVVKGPRQAFALVDAPRITEDSVARWAVTQLANEFPTQVERLELRFTCEPIDGAFYHYSHGLKKHAGNCQRIAHGHRSRIEVFLDDMRSGAEESRWAQRWQDIYLGTREDLGNDETATQFEFAYVAQQGDFSLSIPARMCELIDTDSTVEHLAQYIADRIAEQHPGRTVRVRAFEGLGKGAIATSHKPEQ